MSLDSRLLRPSRSNRSSARSALVSVGVTKVGSKARSGGESGRAMAAYERLVAETAAEVAGQRGDHARDHALNDLIGQGSVVVAQLEADRQAALAFGEAGHRVLRRIDIEQRRIA